MVNIALPHGWSPRPYQRELFRYMFEGGPERKRAVQVWHRRAGKDSTALNMTAVLAHMRVGTYWHMLPTLTLARKVVWDGIDRQGRRIIDQAFPKELRAATRENDMMIRFKNGSVWQCVGSDNYDNLIGTNPVGVVFSEYSVADPAAWDYIRPILAENDGWAVFIYTPRGKNHGYDLYKMAEQNPQWFCSLLTVEDTTYDDGRTVVPLGVVDEERAAGMPEQMVQQEFYCSFDAGLVGAFYTEQMKYLESKHRIGDVPWDPSRPVHTFWDIGIRDATAIWFAQEDEYGNKNFIDYMHGSNVPIIEWCKRVNSLPYIYGTHNGPHDLEHREMTTGKTRKEVAAEFGIDFDIVPNIPIMDGIDAVKAFLPMCRFNETNCADGIDALWNYRREYNEKLHIFMDRPLHDWASHGADAMRMAAIAWPDAVEDTYEMKYKVKRALP